MPSWKRPAAVASPWPRRLRVALPIALLCVLGGCAAQQTGGPYAYRLHTRPTHVYPPPGPPDDPWGPYIHEASQRFGVPELWIREVMRQESGGDETAVSSAGAMGLMQLMPTTYETLREQYGFGDDPFEPHDNVLAGTAYIREMYDRYGTPGFLAAYNAGPQRVDDYLATGDPLPDETVGYLASIAPRIAGTLPETGPLSVYGGNGAVQYAAAPGGGTAIASAVSACDPDAAYDPARPCAPAPTLAVAANAVPAAPRYAAASAGPTAIASAVGACDPDAAYDPARPCVPAPTLAVAANAVPAAPMPPAPVSGGSMIYDPYAANRMAPPQMAASGAGNPVPALAASGLCDPNAAYNPTRPCAPQPTLAAVSGPVPAVGASPIHAAAPVLGTGDWAIQVGAFMDPERARAAATEARLAAPDLLRAARLVLPLTEPFGTTVLYRAQLTDLSARSASEACMRLMQREQPCMVVPPGHG
jgi:D-alanyl-D-alanine carboxypeptidase